MTAYEVKEMTVTLNSDGLILIPEHIRSELQLAPGCEFTIKIGADGDLILRRETAREVAIREANFDRAIGSADIKWDTDELMVLLRGEGLMVLVDSNVILDVVTSDPVWESWSALTMKNLARTEILVINPVIYAEVSDHFTALWQKLEDSRGQDAASCMEAISPQAAFPCRKSVSCSIKTQWRHSKTSLYYQTFSLGAHAAGLQRLSHPDPRRSNGYADLLPHRTA